MIRTATEAAVLIKLKIRCITELMAKEEEFGPEMSLEVLGLINALPYGMPDNALPELIQVVLS